jgi:hypothetical protein
LAQGAADATTSEDAMRFSQAASNMAHAMESLVEAERTR